MTVSQKIFILLDEKNMSQKEFAERTGISQSTISDWKRKKTNPSAEKIMKICEVLQVTPYELLEESSIRPVDGIVLSAEETILLESFRKLDRDQKSRLLGYAEGLADKQN